MKSLRQLDLFDSPYSKGAHSDDLTAAIESNAEDGPDADSHLSLSGANASLSARERSRCSVECDLLTPTATADFSEENCHGMSPKKDSFCENLSDELLSEKNSAWEALEIHRKILLARGEFLDEDLLLPQIDLSLGQRWLLAYIWSVYKQGYLAIHLSDFGEPQAPSPLQVWPEATWEVAYWEADHLIFTQGSPSSCILEESKPLAEQGSASPCLEAGSGIGQGESLSPHIEVSSALQRLKLWQRIDWSALFKTMPADQIHTLYQHLVEADLIVHHGSRLFTSNHYRDYCSFLALLKERINTRGLQLNDASKEGSSQLRGCDAECSDAIDRHCSIESGYEELGSVQALERDPSEESVLLPRLIFGDEERFESSFERVAASLNFQQRRALELALRSPLFVLNGGPGTGKTYTLLRILKLAEELKDDLRIVITAPTGKACRRIEEDPHFHSPHVEIMTLHKLLRLQGSRELQFHRYHRLPYHLIVVDEASMLDARMMRCLLDATDHRSVLILLGDPHQLPPVESGGYFHELSELLKARLRSSHVELSESRRMQLPALYQGAQAIVDRSWDAFKKLIDDGNVQLHDPQELLRPKAWLLDALGVVSDLSDAWQRQRHTKLLCSFRKTYHGAEAMNHRIIELCCRERQAGYLPILITSNQSELGLVNGQMGLVAFNPSSYKRSYAVKALSSAKLMLSPGSDESLPLGLVTSLQWGFAMTVHKAQGSEYDQPWIYLPQNSHIFGASLLYTAWTRAKNGLRLYSDLETLEKIFRSPPLASIGLVEDFMTSLT